MRKLILAASLLSVGVVASEQSPDIEVLRGEAQSLVRQFVGQLKPQLQQAMQEGGPVQAIAVCASVAPGIADALSESSGWQVRRVSLKQRNASRAVPDPWEKQVLMDFDARQEQGEAATTLVHDQLQSHGYRYMQAQIAEPLCLVCHGENLAPQVEKVLDEYYPQDMATGYQPGQVRGAVSVSRLLREHCSEGEAEC